MNHPTPLLALRDLVVEFDTMAGRVRAVDGVSLDVFPEESLALVGESGCGKTVTALSILRLVPQPPGRIAGGSIRFDGRDLLALPESGMRAVRGRDIAMIFQEPMTALNPVFTVGAQLGDVIRRHQRLSRREARKASLALLEQVGIPEPGRRIDEYPHQLSGGQRQRVMIAMALSCGPRLLVADEPTTALDVTTQAQVLEEIRRLQAEYRMAMILVTHDLGIVAETCTRAVVMYCGQVVEAATTAALFSRPHHPYTVGLLDSIPRLRETRLAELPVIPGRVPDPLQLPAGCRFADRCPRVSAECRVVSPPLVATADGGLVACYHPHP
ncbi:MAG: dipeptide/oligopeptide/nickel ABC transporter ATP-binding protein [Gammaproteobacteria bacterium]|nr:MAG: ABC transporter ATP-binding protein [Pseudomonadota bacterium]MBC6945836.1 ABC transporter ATP-binding protein [Gammaproteobacteria bacterium]MCE7895425.1 ABC transporter ATP-binding protein [Gammaproteobacteria bacterium PRO8]MDL1879822.1 ABC transporter ATP-binding protein [Gammaproteobacteria bacterium PRO2]NUP85559.1 ABC transporter ATP-binding protein [Burkholderiaceae bacterium]